MHKLILMFLCLFAITLNAGDKEYSQGMLYYNTKDYARAYPIILIEAQKENRAAQYRIAEMYENGYGVKADHVEAMKWYKLSSAEHSYIERDRSLDSNLSYLCQVENQIGEDSIKRGNEFSLSKMDTDTPETRKLVKSLTSGRFFGLQPYDTNFILPFSYAKEKPARVSALFHPNNLPAGVQQSDLEYNENTEVEFQISLKKQLSYDLFGMNEFVYFAYTQKVWWQLYSDSAPFRETNYLPEIFVTIPSSKSLDDVLGLKTIKFGFLHESNGQEGYRSRSWNRLYASAGWQWGNWFLDSRVWYRIPESEKEAGYYKGTLGPDYVNVDGDDNPDIDKYLGYGDIKLDYLNGKSKYGLLLRNNFRFNGDNKGAIEFNWSYPFFDSPNTFWYVKLFNGYGESLIDYNRQVSKAAFGFSFSRGLF